MNKYFLSNPRKMAEWLGYKIIKSRVTFIDYSFCWDFIGKFIYLESPKDIWHEVGHAFFNEFKDDLEALGVQELFGDHTDVYFHISMYLKDWEDRFEFNSSYPTKYAQLHPSEDWAECFQVVARKKWKPVFVNDEKLQAKYDFIRDFVLSKAG
jgi:hypothetical protein